MASLRLAARRVLGRQNPASFHRTPAASLLLIGNSRRWFSDVLQEPRDAMEFDVVTVGGGPAGLAAAIRLKQLANEAEKDLEVCVIDKGSEIGAHILSGNVFETRALDELMPDWRKMDTPIQTKVTDDAFYFLTESNSLRIPNMFLPPQLHNDGNYIVSLSQLTRWLGEQAEELGVEIYPGFAASEVLFDEETGGVVGVATGDQGISKMGEIKDSFERGIELRARQTLFSEGCRGFLSEKLMKRFNLREDCDVQTYGLGLKEVWEIPEEKHMPGYVQHTLGWPLQNGPFDKTFGGSFLYHTGTNQVLVGFVVGLDYENPYLNPYREFQRWKHHPEVSKHLEGGRCIQYGARALNEGGYHAIPKLTFPGGALLGCSAGFLNSVKIKGTHTSMKSGIVAGEAVFDLLTKEDSGADSAPQEATEYQNKMETSWVYDELKQVRNCHGAFEHGLLPGLAYSAASAFVLKGNEPWTFHNKTPDYAKTKPASECPKIEYPKPDGVLSFDLLTNLTLSGTGHNDDQPSHLHVKEDKKDCATSVSMPTYAGPEQRFCPAGVYTYSDEDADGKQELLVGAQNCLHCKTCDIKMPEEYVEWRVPEGGGGPLYTSL